MLRRARHALTRRERWRPDLPKVLRFSMDINSAFYRKRPLKAVLVVEARGEIKYLLKCERGRACVERGVGAELVVEEEEERRAF